MKELEVVTQNLAGWGWQASKERWDSRLERALSIIKENSPKASIIALQEFMAGTNGKYLEIVTKMFPEYELILPKAYKPEPTTHPAITITLVKKEGYRSHSLRTLEGEELKGSLRYNYFTLNLDCEKGCCCFVVLNAHIPQTSLNENKSQEYQQERHELAEAFRRSITNEAKTFGGDPDMHFILLGDLNTNPKDAWLQKLSYSLVDNPLFDPITKENLNRSTWIDPLGTSSNHLDYILYSTALMCLEWVKAKYTDIIDEPIAEKVSDHCLIKGTLLLDI